jgi:hypothetical protein
MPAADSESVARPVPGSCRDTQSRPGRQPRDCSRRRDTPILSPASLYIFGGMWARGRGEEPRSGNLRSPFSVPPGLLRHLRREIRRRDRRLLYRQQRRRRVKRDNERGPATSSRTTDHRSRSEGDHECPRVFPSHRIPRSPPC